MKKLIILIFSVGVAACGSNNIDAAKENIRLRLKDPGSAKFDSLKEYSENVVCGNINAKNAFGGYVGNQRFIYFGDTKGPVRNDVKMGNEVTDDDVALWCKDGKNKYLTYLEEKFFHAKTKCDDGFPVMCQESKEFMYKILDYNQKFKP